MPYFFELGDNIQFSSLLHFLMDWGCWGVVVSAVTQWLALNVLPYLSPWFVEGESVN